MTEWQPIETAPKDGTHILVVSETGISVCKYSCGNWNGLIDGDTICYQEEQDDWYYDVYKPTHWMPLPEPPQQETKGFDEYGFYGENNGPV